MFSNPNLAEFRRNLWLEFSKTRLLILTIVMGLAYVTCCVYLTDTRPYQANSAIKYFLNGTVFIGLLWGVSRVVDSIREEISNSTWDFQRLSALPPLSLMFGKIMGSASFALFSATILYALGIILILQFPEGSIAQEKTSPAFFRQTNFTGFKTDVLQYYLQIGAVIFFAIILSYFAAFAATLQMAHGLQSRKKIGDIALKGSAILLGGVFIYTAMGFLRFNTNKYGIGMPELTWYSSKFTLYGFLIYSMVLSILWAFYGAYLSTRKELQFAVTPFAIILFALTCALYLCGFTPDKLMNFRHNSMPAPIVTYSYICFPLFLGMACILCLAEDISVLRYKKTLKTFKENSFFECWANSPRWVYIMIMALFPLFIIIGGTPDAFTKTAAYFFISLLFFAGRDLAVWHILNFKFPQKGNFITFGIYGAIAYIMLPFLLHSFTKDSATAFVFLPVFELSRSAGASLNLSLLAPSFLQFLCGIWALVYILQTKARENR